MDVNAPYRMLIDGQLVDAAADFDVVNPATGKAFASAPDASADDLDHAVAAAARAFPGWRKTPIEERRAAILAAAKAIAAHSEALAPLFTMEQGRSLDASRMELGGTVAWYKAIARREIPVEIQQDDDKRRIEIRREPIGVVGAIAPWNAPVLLASWKIGPALLAGNTVILKPSPFTPLCTLKIAELMAEHFPAGVLNVISGSDALGPMMTRHPGIAKISFTGSTTTGRRVMEGAAATLKKVTLELGGNDAAIVMPDVDVDAIAEQIFFGAFGNSAQICIAIKRLYIHDDVYDALFAKLKTLVDTVKIGDGLDPDTRLGPLQNAAQQRRVLALIEGARVAGYPIYQGKVPEGEGFFVPITLVDNPPEDAPVVTEEAFGPVLPLLRFSDVEDVIARANASEYGLGGSVWTRDLDLAVTIAERLETGNVWINSAAMPSPMIPFAGHKQSGIGVENGQEGLLEYTQPKAIHIIKR